MKKFNGALAMGIIIAATSGLVAAYAFAADPAAGTNSGTNSAPAQTAPANTGNTNAGSPAANSTTAPGDSNAGTAAAPNDQVQNKANNATQPDPNKSGTTQSGQAATPTTNTDQAAEAQKPSLRKQHMAMSRKHVEAVQAALANSGQTVAIDGVWGPKTTEALKHFQKAHGLKATGHLDHATRDALPKST